MANVNAYADNVIYSGELGNKEAVSCAGVPGMGLPSVYAYVNTRIRTLVDETGVLWFANVDGTVAQYDMRDDYGDSDWLCSCVIEKDPFSITWPVGTTNMLDQLSGRAFQTAVWHSAAAGSGWTGVVNYNLADVPTNTDDATTLGYKNSGYTLEDLGVVTSDGTVQTTTVNLYVCYPITYGTDSGTTSELTISSLALSFDFTSLVPEGSYYPWAMHESGWQSLNRDGGLLGTRENDAWRDLLNVADDADESCVFYRENGWQVAPLME